MGELQDKLHDIDLDLYSEAKLGSYESITVRDTEIAKLKAELVRAKTKYEEDLAFEKEARRQVEEKSLGLVSDINVSHQKKMNDMHNELQLQKTIVVEREVRIDELNEAIAKMRNESAKFQKDIHKSFIQTNERQRSDARKVRGSISSMESKLFQNKAELEQKMMEMNSHHEEELVALQNALQRQEAEYKEKLDEQSAELANLQGRLEESRNSRKATLEEMRQMRKKYNGTLKGLEECLEEMNEKNNVLETGSEKVTGKIKSLESEIEEGKGKQEELAAKLEQAESLLKQKEKEIMENQLKISQPEMESKLSELNGNHERELATLQQALKKQESELKEKLEEKTQEFVNLLEKLEDSKTFRKAIFEEMRDLKKAHAAKVDGLEESLEKMSDKCKTLENEQSDKLKGLENENEALKGSKDMLAAKVEEMETILKQKIKIFKENEIKITQQVANISILKEACDVLENQMAQFEQDLQTKCDQLTLLQTENSNLKQRLDTQVQDTKKARQDLNETKSLYLFQEMKVKELENNLETNESSMKAEIERLDRAVENLTLDNQELLDELRNVRDEGEGNEIRLTHMTSLNGTLKLEMSKLADDGRKIVQELVKLKGQNIELRENLALAIEKGESYKAKLMETKAELSKMEEQDKHSKLVLETNMAQHLKLIEHMNRQNEVLKKKKGFFSMFTKEPEKEPACKHQFVVAEFNTTISRRGQTPRSLLKEHNTVRTLEEEAANLKKHLDFLQSARERENVVPVTPAKENCILLKEAEEEEETGVEDEEEEEDKSLDSEIEELLNQSVQFEDFARTRRY